MKGETMIRIQSQSGYNALEIEEADQAYRLWGVSGDGQERYFLGTFKSKITAARAMYHEVCHILSMDTEIGFVKITRNGLIGFTCGKPDEIRTLLSAVERCKLVPTAGLRRTVAQYC